MTALATDGASVIYGFVDSGCDLNNDDCQHYRVSGAVYRLAGKTVSLIPHSGPSLAVAVSGERVALLLARHAGTQADEWQRPPASAPLAIRSLLSGALIVAIPPPVGRTYQAVALAGDTAAVLAMGTGATWLQRYRLPAGVSTAAVRVPIGASGLELSANGDAIFSSGRKVMLVKAGGSTVTTLATTHHVPVGLSVVGRRVAWACLLPKNLRICIRDEKAVCDGYDGACSGVRVCVDRAVALRFRQSAFCDTGRGAGASGYRWREGKQLLLHSEAAPRQGVWRSFRPRSVEPDRRTLA